MYRMLILSIFKQVGKNSARYWRIMDEVPPLMTLPAGKGRRGRRSSWNKDLSPVPAPEAFEVHILRDIAIKNA